jgi:hypothetical protein
MNHMIDALMFQKRAIRSRKQVIGTLNPRMRFSEALSLLQRVARGNQTMPAALRKILDAPPFVISTSHSRDCIAKLHIP